MHHHLSLVVAVAHCKSQLWLPRSRGGASVARRADMWSLLRCTRVPLRLHTLVLLLGVARPSGQIPLRSALVHHPATQMHSARFVLPAKHVPWPEHALCGTPGQRGRQPVNLVWIARDPPPQPPRHSRSRTDPVSSLAPAPWPPRHICCCCCCSVRPGGCRGPLRAVMARRAPCRGGARGRGTGPAPFLLRLVVAVAHCKSRLAPT
jgi:hypothetical protein